MIDPASAADWLQASLMAGLVGGVAAFCTRALHEERVPLPAAARIPSRERERVSSGR